MAGYNPNNYATVAERLAAATPEIASIITEPPQFMTETMGYIRATVSLLDGRSATGMASFRLDLQGKGAQATNPLEDGETSAVGRALAFLGYASNKSIASHEEVQEARRRENASYEQRPARPAAPQGRQVQEQPQDAQPRMQKPRNVSEAKERFFARYSSALGGETWRHVTEFLKVNELEPNTIDGWIDAAQRVSKREQELVEA